MLTSDLALIFQPGILSHPIHAMRPRDHVLSQQVLEFLIDHQDSFLLGMQLVSNLQDTADSRNPSRRSARKPKQSMYPPLHLSPPQSPYRLLHSHRRYSTEPRPI